jgi:hypothetical protein
MSARFARQISLGEIGTTGQAQIEASVVRAGRGDARAMSVALDYLERAGVRTDEGGPALDVPGADALTALAGRPELVEAAAFLVGSLAATTHLAGLVGIDSRVARLPPLSPSEP